ncbi:hypothetical protein BGX38DRAFT_1138687 [Terfezia claveryi]|nr:hypothetical protein BGX38DRAFT_1138687 [Terfezia claveryi]
MQLRGGKTVKPASSKAYVGKGRVLSQKEVDKGIAKLVQWKEDEQAAALKQTEKAAAKKLLDEAKAICNAEYQMACEAALAGGLPKPKRPRIQAKPTALRRVGTSSRGGASRVASGRGSTSRGGTSRGRGCGSSRGGRRVISEINVEVNTEFEELDEAEIEELRRVEQIQEFFEGLE